MTILLLQKVKNQFTTFGGLKENPACAGRTPNSLKSRPYFAGQKPR